MKNETIKVKAGIKYVSEFMAELPKNVIFAKNLTGSGATSLALTNNQNVVVCVPFTSLIENKVSQSLRDSTFYPYEILGIYGDIKPQQITEYVGRKQTKKIMVTFDSLPKLMEYINPKDYTIVIDEFHIMTTAYEYRQKAVHSVLDNFKAFESYTFVSATPIARKYLFEELENIPQVDLDWEDNSPVKLISSKCMSIEASTAKIIKEFLDGEQLIKDSNLYIFVNSVNFMESMIKSCNLTSDNCRAIYSRGNTKEISIGRGDALGEPKKINFFSSTAYEGLDLLDLNGVILVVSDPTKIHTLVDISTSLLQIAGRLRNSPHTDTVNYIYKTNKYLDSSCALAEDYERELMKAFNKEKAYFDMVMNSDFPDELKTDSLINDKFNFTFKDKYTNLPKMSLNKIRVEVRNFEILRGFYRSKVNMRAACEASGFEFIETDDLADTKKTVNIYNVKEEERHLELMLAYLDSDPLVSQVAVAKMQEKFSWLWEAICEIGAEEIVNLKGRRTAIDRKIKYKRMKEQSSSVAHIISEKFLDKYRLGNFIPLKKIKEDLGKIYKELGIDLAPKAVDLKQYFMVTEGSKNIEGKKILGYNLITNKFKKFSK